MPHLLIDTGTGKPSPIGLDEHPKTLGRDGICEVVLDDLKASRQHARIQLDENGDYLIEDLGSKNGTLINGQPLRRHRLIPGDRIEIGTTLLIFQDAQTETIGSHYVVRDRLSKTESTSVVGRQEKFQLSQQRLEMLSGLTERIVRLRDQTELLNEVMTICFETLSFERGLIALKNQPGQPVFEPIVRNLREDETGQFAISRSILRRAMEDGERTIINDAATELADPTVSMATHNIRSAMCVPMEYNDEILGVIYGDRVTSTTSYGRQDVDFLASVARQASLGLANARMMNKQRRVVQLENELNVARQIQNGLFPGDFEPTSQLWIRAFNEPGRQVSGDTYDIVRMSEGRIGLVIADVTGKGVAAALLSANLQAAVRVTLPSATDPADVVAQWNTLLCENTDQTKFVTLLLMVIDPVARVVEYVNAGHPAPFKLSPPGEPLEIQGVIGLPLGIIPDEQYQTVRLDLGPESSSLLMFTDGIPEAMNEQGEMFELSRLRDILNEVEKVDPENLISELRGQIKRFSGRAEQADDITILVAHLP